LLFRQWRRETDAFTMRGMAQDSTPFVSVLVVSYNYEAYVADAIGSALRQSYPMVEVIAVDDGSTDRSPEILAQFADRIGVIAKRNGGETSAVNRAFAASRGEIVLFLDSDDLLEETAIEEVVAAWRPGTAKVQFRLAAIDGQGRLMGQTAPAYPTAFSAADVRELAVRRGFYPSPPTTGNAYSRRFLAQVLPLDSKRYPFAPDGILNTIAPLYGDVRTVDKPLGRYRIHGENMWASLTLNPARMLAAIAQGRKEAAALLEHARRRGVRLDDVDPLDHSFVFLERRLAAVKLAPADPRVAGDRAWRLFWRACRCVRDYERGALRQAARLGWFLATALAPRPLAEWLLRLRFAPASRSRLLHRVVLLARR